MKNNKGFSLVELIIVIAIMAILVGVMAPQLIKYIEKTNVSSDTQLADTVKSAFTTAMLDPAVINDTSYTFPTSGDLATAMSSGGTAFATAVEETLGCSAADCVLKLKSDGASGIQIDIINSNTIKVTITGSHADGKGGPDPIVVQ